MSLKEAHEALGFYEVDARLVKIWLEAGEILLVDVRETVEYEQEHIAGSVLCPLSVFNPDLFPQIPEKLVVLHCAIGKRSAAAAKQLINKGHFRIANLKGGIKAWKKIGGPTEAQILVPDEPEKLPQLCHSISNEKDNQLFTLTRFGQNRHIGDHPGLILLEEFLSPLRISQAKLSKELKIPSSRINAIVKGRVSINADTALRLAQFFCTTEEFWLHLQVTHDLEKTRKASGARIKSDIQNYKK